MHDVNASFFFRFEKNIGCKTVDNREDRPEFLPFIKQKKVKRKPEARPVNQGRLR